MLANLALSEGGEVGPRRRTVVLPIDERLAKIEQGRLSFLRAADQIAVGFAAGGNLFRVSGVLLVGQDDDLENLYNSILC